MPVAEGKSTAGVFTLSHNGATSDAVSDVAEARVHVKHLGRLRLFPSAFANGAMVGEWPTSLHTFEYLQHLKNGVMRTRPTL